MLEFTWTVVPRILLYSLRVPSLYLIYYIERATKYDLSIKVVGHQWYWSYEISEYSALMNFDSYIINNQNLKFRDFRLLEVDNSVVLPFLTKIRTLVTSSDVLHSWSLPSIGLKVDACPRRLNFINLNSFRPVSIYRQCSELCRVNHSFIPIHVEFLSWDDFLKSNVS